MQIVYVLLITLIPTIASAVNPLKGLPKPLATLHKALGRCDKEAAYASKVYKLTEDRDLYIVPCFSGPTYGIDRLYIVEVYNSEEASIEQLPLLNYSAETHHTYAELDWPNTKYDPRTKTLTTVTMSRVATCGRSTITKFSVNEPFYEYRTTEIREHMECEKRVEEWPVVFSQPSATTTAIK